jgi:D-alanyl-D-alanine carboxypeptidase
MRMLAAGLASMGAAGALLTSVTPAGAFSPAQISAFQAAMQTEAANAGYPGFMIGVWARGQGRFVSATGVSDLATGVPLSTAQPSRIGSVTKTFTGTLLMQLVQKGEVGLNDRLSEYVKGIPRGRKITIRELLDHTGGNPDISPLIAQAVFAFPSHHWTPAQLIRWSVGQPRECAPGSCWFYSNLDFWLVGRIVEKVTGRDLSDLYRRRIFDPLGLDDTEFRNGSAVPANIAHGYLQHDGTYVDATHLNSSWIWSAGSMVSTLADLHTYASALATGHGLLDRRTQRKRLTFVKTTIPHVRYGLGLFKIGSYIGHNGEVPGYDAMVLHSPRDDVTIVVLGTTSVTDDQFLSGRQPDAGLFDIFRTLKGIVASG